MWSKGSTFIEIPIVSSTSSGLKAKGTFPYKSQGSLLLGRWGCSILRPHIEPTPRWWSRGFFDVFVTKLTTGRMIDGSLCGGIDMIIKDLDFEPKIDAMMRDFLEYVLKTSPCFRERFTLMLLEHQDVIP
ncbi:hypothetical protein Tco_1086506 [Tanacetum coccineum]